MNSFFTAFDLEGTLICKKIRKEEHSKGLKRANSGLIRYK